MRIGELAKAAGVHVQTIRFYERRRLLPPPQLDRRAAIGTTARNNPWWSSSSESSHGYTLREIRELLALAERGTHITETVHDRAKKKVRGIETEIVRLCGIRDWLQQFVSHSESDNEPANSWVLRRSVTRAAPTPISLVMDGVSEPDKE